MSDTPNIPQDEQLTTLLAQAEEAARQAHALRLKADDDAGYANNAKLAAEEHSKSIAAFKGQAEADSSWFTATKQGVEQAHASIMQIRAEAESVRQTIAETGPDLEKTKATVKSCAEHADALRTQAERATVEAAGSAKAAFTSAANSEGFAEAAEEAAKKAEKLLKQVAEHVEKAQEQAKQIDEAVAAINKANESAQALVVSMAASSKKSTEVLDVIVHHESDLSELKSQCSALHARIESLLPNATSAGLATAFRDQQTRFVWPQRGWLTTFVVTIIALLISSLVGLPSADGTWDQLAKHFINRLPLIAPLVWLAVYAGRHYGLALRLQEEYAYKEAVSAAFEGYKREMSAVATAGGSSADPLVTLCESVLRTFGQRPGRIYEGKHEDITALTPLATALKDGAQSMAEAVRGQLPGAKA